MFSFHFSLLFHSFSNTQTLYLMFALVYNEVIFEFCRLGAIECDVTVSISKKGVHRSRLRGTVAPARETSSRLSTKFSNEESCFEQNQGNSEVWIIINDLSLNIPMPQNFARALETSNQNPVLHSLSVSLMAHILGKSIQILGQDFQIVVVNPQS